MGHGAVHDRQGRSVGAVMGRAERKRRAVERREELEADAALAELSAKAGLSPSGMVWNEHDELVPARTNAGGDQDEGSARLPRFVRTREVAAMFGVHPKTVETWRALHGLPCVVVGRSVRFDPSDVLRWASARKEGV